MERKRKKEKEIKEKHRQQELYVRFATRLGTRAKTVGIEMVQAQKESPKARARTRARTRPLRSSTASATTARRTATNPLIVALKPEIKARQVASTRATHRPTYPHQQGRCSVGP